jgi:hypothetical protein
LRHCYVLKPKLKVWATLTTAKPSNLKDTINVTNEELYPSISTHKQVVHRPLPKLARVISGMTSSVDLSARSPWNKPLNLKDTLNVTNEELYPSISTVLLILYIMPASTATTGRSFAVLRRLEDNNAAGPPAVKIKTYCSLRYLNLMSVAKVNMTRFS